MRDREKQRQYFTGSAQSSSAGTQYLQPTAMQQQISVCVWVGERETKRQRETGKTVMQRMRLTLN